MSLGTWVASLTENPISICVNTEIWNEYTGGLMSSAQCGGMDSDDGGLMDYASATRMCQVPLIWWVPSTSSPCPWRSRQITPSLQMAPVVYAR